MDHLVLLDANTMNNQTLPTNINNGGLSNNGSNCFIVNDNNEQSYIHNNANYIQ